MKLSFNDTKSIEQLPFFQDTLHQPASFEIDLSGFTDAKRCSVSENVLKSIYVISRSSERMDSMVSLKPLEEDAASSDDGALEKLRAPYPKAAQASMTQRDAFTLSNLPEDIKRRLQDSNILSKFSTIEFHFRTRSDGSILPQLTRTLPEYYKTPETESGRLSSLPVDNKTNEGRDPDNYKWETLDFTSEVELCVDVNSDRTKVLPWYDEERTKETMRSVMGDWKSIPAVSVCYVKATTS